ncbi:MAG: hypothetical protein ACREBW_10540 [Candidatus Micrarchaeaceae archaeon]
MASQFTAWLIVVWVDALIVVAGLKAATGQINLSGLLSDSRPDGSRAFSPERAQLLLNVLAGIFAYAQSALTAGKMVEPSTVTVAGSQTLYVAGKFIRHLLTT